VSPERDDYEDDEERDEFAPRSIFSAGWFRAVLVLTVLAIVVVISLPYLLNWFEPAPPPRVAKPVEAPKPAPAVATPAPVAPPAAEVKPVPPVPAPAPKAGAPTTPAPKLVGDKVTSPTSPEPARKASEKSASKALAERAAVKAPLDEKVPLKASADRAAAKPAAVPERTPVKAVEKAPAKPADKVVPTRVAAKVDAPSRPTAVASAKPPSEGAAGSYWIQVGAFKEQKNADVLAKSLRAAGFPVHVTAIARGAGGESAGPVQRHELFVTDASVDKVTAALKGQGTAQTVSGGVVVRPSMSLQEAMTMSKRLTDQGLKVVIRPAGGLAAAAPSQPSLHAVRAGAYSNRTSALAAREELAAKGHQGFLAEGPAK
jgi:cell division septation protein DedD